LKVLRVLRAYHFQVALNTGPLIDRHMPPTIALRWQANTTKNSMNRPQEWKRMGRKRET